MLDLELLRDTTLPSLARRGNDTLMALVMTAVSSSSTMPFPSSSCICCCCFSACVRTLQPAWLAPFQLTLSLLRTRPGISDLSIFQYTRGRFTILNNRRRFRLLGDRVLFLILAVAALPCSQSVSLYGHHGPRSLLRFLRICCSVRNRMRFVTVSRVSRWCLRLVSIRARAENAMASKSRIRLQRLISFSSKPFALSCRMWIILSFVRIILLPFSLATFMQSTTSFSRASMFR
mmetsp:Transcript_2917/g.4570  ORF Transcript_2917/g.4570 Transcript_2917/m.4570 type:complete len:233 (+) Transcript_2917:435-1133(+)